MFTIEIQKTGEVFGIECYIINQVFIDEKGQRGEVRRLAKTVTQKAAVKLARTIKQGLYNEGRAAA